MPCRCGRAVRRAPRLRHGARPFATSSPITPTEPWVEQRPPRSAVQHWLTPARLLQERADQPLPHAMTPADFLVPYYVHGRKEGSPWYKPDASEQYIPLGEGRRPMGEALASPAEWAGDDAVRLGSAAPGVTRMTSTVRVRRPERATDNPILETLQGVAEGAGVTVLRLSEHRETLRQHSPHELALTALGIAMALGVKPMRREHLLYVRQASPEGKQHAIYSCL